MNDLKRVFSFIKPFRKEFLAAVIFVMAETGFELVIPLLMADIIDTGIPSRDIRYILQLGIQMSILAVLSLITGLLYARYAAKTAMGYGAAVREAEFAKIQSYSFSNLDHFSTSSLITRLTTDITVMQNALTGGLRPMIRGPFMLVMGIFLAFLMNRKLALVFIVCTPLLGIILALIVRKVAPLYSRQQNCMDHLNRVVQENITAIRAIKAFVRGEREEERFQVANETLMDTSRTTFHYAVLNVPSFQLTMYTSIVLILWFGGNFIQAGSMKVGELTGFLSYVMQIINSLMMISNVFLMLTRSLASARRICEVFDEKPALSSPEHPTGTIRDGSIDFDHVSFKYHQNAKEYTMRDISLHIPSGSTVGIIGGTGSSKSTLVQLIPRLYDVTEGSVRVGGSDVRECPLHQLRDQVAIVLQKNVLFSGTIRENLQWGNASASDEELWEACRMACAHEFVSSFPDGLGTMLEEGGGNLSGGQRQRLCIARTLLKKPKVLIFDDSTSAVDTATEGKIRQALLALPETTKLIIAQRITSVMHADQIIILEDGRIHAVGDHPSLLASDPVYQEIYASQMKGGMEDGAN